MWQWLLLSPSPRPASPAGAHALCRRPDQDRYPPLPMRWPPSATMCGPPPIARFRCLRQRQSRAVVGAGRHKRTPRATLPLLESKAHPTRACSPAPAAHGRGAGLLLSQDGPTRRRMVPSPTPAWWPAAPPPRWSLPPSVDSQRLRCARDPLDSSRAPPDVGARLISRCSRPRPATRRTPRATGRPARGRSRRAS